MIYANEKLFNHRLLYQHIRLTSEGNVFVISSSNSMKTSYLPRLKNGSGALNITDPLVFSCCFDFLCISEAFESKKSTMSLPLLLSLYIVSELITFSSPLETLF